MKWISVEDKVPEVIAGESISPPVLIFDTWICDNTPTARISIGWFNWEYDHWESYESDHSYITHWMPLPKPPEIK